MKDVIFVRLDCDSVGDKIELALFNSDHPKAQTIHNTIQANISKLKSELQTNMDIALLMTGSDDILFSIAKAKYNVTLLEAIKTNFYSNTGFTLSIGVGYSITEALMNLKIAKISGKNLIVAHKP